MRPYSDGIFPKLFRFPQYLKEINYRNPDNTQQPNPFQYCMETELPTFEWLAQNPSVANNFNLFMTNHRAQTHWTETFPIQAEIFDGVTINEDAPLVVDVAGGFGHDLRIVKDKLQPVAKGRFVLEDQASVIDTVPDNLRDSEIEYVKYNFFTPQPVKGARVYTLKSIIHDWPDHQALEILNNIASGMTPGYSKIWILDGIVPATNTPRALVGMDIIMMISLGALERTEKQWYGLLEKAGLVVTKVVPRPDGFGVIEAMLK